VKKRVFRGLFWIGLLLPSTALLAQSQLLNHNLVVNGDAEADAGVANPASSQVKPSGWTVSQGSTFSVMSYPTVTSFVYPPSRGKNLFYGGPGKGSGTCSASQASVDLTPIAPMIQGGGVRFVLSAYLGAVELGALDPSTVTLRAVFTDNTGAQFTTWIGGPTPTDINNPAGLLYRSVTGLVPKNAQSVQVSLDLAKGEGNYNSLAADNISLVLSTDAMFGANLIVNGNAEAAAGTPVPGWSGSILVEADPYGDSGMPATTDPGPADRAANLLYSSYWGSTSTSQYFDVTGASADIDAGYVYFQAAGWLGGATNIRDDAVINVAFYPAGSVGGNPTALSRITVGPVTPADRGNRTGLLQRSTIGKVPIGTRRIVVSLTFERLQNTADNNTAYADDISFVLADRPKFAVNSIVNAASSLTGSVAPGEMVVIYGSGLGPAQFTPYNITGSKFDNNVALARILFDGVAAPIIYTSSGQTAVVVPYEVKGTTQVVAEYLTNQSAPVAVPVVSAAPGLFSADASGSGPAAALNENNTGNSAANPIARGHVVVLFATIGGDQGQDGVIAQSAQQYPATVTATVGGLPAVVQYAGPSPGLIWGVSQVNVVIPPDAPVGPAVPITITAAGAKSQTVTIAVQ
jgi:uncharacterized protein (TIGR03437 family)